MGYPNFSDLPIGIRLYPIFTQMTLSKFEILCKNLSYISFTRAKKYVRENSEDDRQTIDIRKSFISFS